MSQKPKHTHEPTSISTTETVFDTSLPGMLYAQTPTKDRLRLDEAAAPQPRPEATMTTGPMTSPTSDFTSDDKGSSPQTPSPSSSNYIPDEPNGRAGRTLVVCFDGTGDQFDSDNSNVVALVKLLKKDDNKKQMVYYQAGIGTYLSPQVATPLASKIAKKLDEMVAWNLEAHVMGGYEFLMQNYRQGDKICIFGFSRGSHTAQSLAGMIAKVGLLPVSNHQQVPFAYKLYTQGCEPSRRFKETFSVRVRVEFLGVWDTVSSVGLIPKSLPFACSYTVKTFRHAIALDERRVKFKVDLWDERIHEGKENVAEPNKTEKAGKSIKHHLEKRFLTLDDVQDTVNDSELWEKTNVKEVWFAGCHCDVGGGSVKDDKNCYALARIPLRWMVRECFEAKTGILFLTNFLPDIGLDPRTLYPSFRRPSFLLDRAKERVVEKWSLFSKEQGKSRGPFENEELEELEDALSPMYDQLKINPLWRLLEFSPVPMLYKKNDEEHVLRIEINRCKPRALPVMSRLKVHRSVQLRMEAQGNYNPKAKGNKQWDPEWTD